MTDGAALILADVPERRRLRELVSLLEARRDEIAELDLEIETLREQLGRFEAGYHERLHDEHEALRQIDALARHFDRWSDLLRAACAPQAPAKTERTRFTDKAAKLREKRARELERKFAQQSAEPPAEVQPALPPADRSQRLKAAYRALARRFHPDLARTEAERVRFGETMARINALYSAGDVDRIEALCEQSKGGELDDVALDIGAQLNLLEERLGWFGKVYDNLLDERRALERSKTCELMRDVAQAAELGRDLLAELQEELRERVTRAQRDIREAIHALEQDVSTYNKRAAGGDALQRVAGRDSATASLATRFDPFADKALIRFGLEELGTLRVSREASECAGWVEQVAQAQPALLDALLLAYVSDLSPFPLPGLERFDDVAERFAALQRRRLDEAEPETLEAVLLAAEQVIEFGPKQASERVVHMGLQLRSPAMHEGMLVALKTHAIRRAFKQVLSVIGERKDCAACAQPVYTVPLYRLRGLDALRALVCPDCGATLHSYWMPRGDDVQAVLNTAFIDFELVSEWSFQLGKSSVATQLTQPELEAGTVADLKKRLLADVFKKNGLDLKPSLLWLEQAGKRVPEKTPLDDLDERSFVVQLGEDAKLSPADALELIKHRIRTRFQ